MTKLFLFCVLSILACSTAQRITTIHLDGVQYFISRMNPYSPELNYFLAYQYCRSLGLQLASFETKEKAESMTTYLKNAGYGNYDFWTSGNRLGTGMFLWMSTGLPFNATFDFFENSDDAIQAGLLDPVDHNSNTSPQRTARDSSSGAEKGCVILKQPTLKWMPEDCSAVKDFICEQTRCYYYNYGSIPVSSAQGRPITSTTPRPAAPPLMNRQTSTTPLPILMSTNGLFAKKILTQSESQPSFVSLKLNHERALESEYDDLEGETEEHDDADIEENEHEHDHEHDSDSDNLNEQARELSDDVKEHVFPLNDNELQRDEVQSIEKLQQQLQSNTAEYEKDAHMSETETDDPNSQEHDDDNGENDAADLANTDSTADVAGSAVGPVENDDYIGKDAEADKLPATLNAPQQTATIGDKSVIQSTVSATTESPAIEVRLKQIAQDFEKMASDEKQQHRNDNNHNNNNDEITPQSSLSLSDLIRTLRPNDKQIVPQIDSDYSNAMRVLGKTSAVVNNEDSRKFKVLPDAHTHTSVI